MKKGTRYRDKWDSLTKDFLIKKGEFSMLLSCFILLCIGFMGCKLNPKIYLNKQERPRLLSILTMNMAFHWVRALGSY